MNPGERMHYIGAVALLVRMHTAMPHERRVAFDEDGDPFARLARDFNAHGFSLRMVRNGQTWMLDEAPETGDASVGPFPAEPSGPRWVARHGGEPLCPSGTPHDVDTAPPAGFVGPRCRLCGVALIWEGGR